MACILLAGLWLASALIIESAGFHARILDAVNARIPGTLAWDSLDLSLFRGRAAARGIRLKTPEGKTVAVIDVLEADLDWTGFAAGELRLSSLKAGTPGLAIKLDRSGQTDLLAALMPRTDSRTGSGPGTGAPPLNLVIDRVLVQKGNLTLDGPGMTAALPEFSLHLSGLNLARQALSLTASFKSSRIQSGDHLLEIPTLEMSARLEQDRVTGLNLKATAPGIDLTLQGGADHIFDHPVLDVTAGIDAGPEAVRTLGNVLGRTLDIRIRETALLNISLKGRPDNPDVKASLTLGPVSLFGQSLSSARLQTGLEDRMLSIAPSRVDPGTGPIEIQGQIDFTQMFPHGFTGKSAGPDTLGYTIDLRQKHLDLSRLSPRLKGLISPSLSFTGKGVVPGRISADLALEAGGSGLWFPDLSRPADLTFRAGAHLDGRTLDIGTLSLEAAGISGSGRASIHFAGPAPGDASLTGDVTLTAPDLAHPADLLGMDLKGSGTLSLTARGPLPAPRIHGELRAEQISARGLDADSLWASLTGDTTGLRIRDARLKKKDGRISAQGEISPDGALAMELTAESLDLGDLAPDLNVQGVFSGSAVVGGALDDPNMTARITGEKIVVRQTPLGRIDTDLYLSRTTLTLTRAELVRGRSRISARGQVDLKNQALDLRVSAPSLNLEDLTGSPAPVSGTAAVTLSARGTLSAPEIEGSITAKEVRTADFPDIRGSLSAAFRARGPLDSLEALQADGNIAMVSISRDGSPLASLSGARISFGNAELKFGPAPVRLLDRGTITLAGALDLEGHLTASARGTLPLATAAAFTEGIRSAEGEVAVSLSARGPVLDPDIEGEITFSNLTLGLEALDQPLREIGGRIRFTPDALRIQELAGQLGEGRFQITGSTRLAGWKPDRFSLEAEARKVSLEFPETLSLVLNSRLTLAGTPEASELTGSIDLLEGRYYRDVDLNLVDLATRRTRAVSPPPEDKGPEILRHMAVNVQIRRRNPLLVDNNLAYLTISPDLTVRGTALSPVFGGRAQVDEGTIFFQKARFDVTGGTVDFVNPYRLQPEIDITGQTVIRSWTITVRVAGTPEDLQLTFSSDPPEPDADILSLIAFGRTTREMGTAQGSGQMAAASAAAGLVADPLGEKIKAATGLDEVNISMAEDNGTAGVKVSLGADLSRQLSVAYGVEVRDGETVQQVTTYYKLLEHLLMNGFQDTGGRFGGGLKYRMEFR